MVTDVIWELYHVSATSMCLQGRVGNERALQAGSFKEKKMRVELFQTMRGEYRNCENFETKSRDEILTEEFLFGMSTTKLEERHSYFCPTFYYLFEITLDDTDLCSKTGLPSSLRLLQSQILAKKNLLSQSQVTYGFLFELYYRGLN